MYGPDDLEVLTSLELAVRLESVYFPEGGFSPAQAVEHIRWEARICGVPELDVQEDGGWWIIASDLDWLPEEERGLLAFARFLHFPEAGVNATRLEVLLTAFAQVVLTSLHGNVAVVVDKVARAQDAVATFADRLSQRGRVIVFLP